VENGIRKGKNKMMFEVFINMIAQKEFQILLLTTIVAVVYLSWKENRRDYERYKKWKASQGWSDH